MWRALAQMYIVTLVVASTASLAHWYTLGYWAGVIVTAATIALVAVLLARSVTLKD